MRLGAVADDGRAALHDLAGHVGVVVEPEDDRDLASQDRAAERYLLAFDVVDPLGRAGAVQLQRQPVDGSGGLQPFPDAPGEDLERVACDATARHCKGPDNRDSLDRNPGLVHRAVVAADLADVAQVLLDRAALEEAERLVVPERRRQRVEVVRLLGNVDQGEAQGPLL
jgi:hypothetical protein